MCIAFTQLLIHDKCDWFHWPPFLMQVVQRRRSHVYNSNVRHIDHIYEGGSHEIQMRECINTTESPHSVHLWIIIVIF